MAIQKRVSKEIKEPKEVERFIALKENDITMSLIMDYISGICQNLQIIP